MDKLKEKIHSLDKELKSSIEKISDLKSLEDFKVKTFGKKSEFAKISKSLSEIPNENKREAGQFINNFKKEFQTIIDDLQDKLKAKETLEKLKNEKIDTSMPGAYIRKGSTHPISLVEKEIIDIFKPLSYSVESGPEIEHDFFNFSALNIPENHPARNMQDTFYVKDKVVLRTHTSPVQIRTMKQKKPPIRILAPGRVYRSDYDVSHTPMFHQVEGLFVDKDVKLSHLKGTLLYFAKRMFGDKTKIRLRPSYFPFTEPSAEVDITCVICGGKGCRVCKNTGWIEILGCGMVHPNVFKAVGYEGVTGFAFGMGIERIAMLKYGINDLRAFFENDVRFLRQFI